MVLFELMEQYSDKVVYKYGYDEENLDGVIEFSLASPRDFKIIQSNPKDEEIASMWLMKGVVKVITFLESGKIEQSICRCV